MPIQQNNLAADLSDEELVGLVLNQDPELFLFIMKRYQDRLLRYVQRISGLAVDDAEDILQDVFIKTFQNLNGFDLEQKFSAWIYRVAHNETISNFRKLKTKGRDLLIKIEPEQMANIASDLKLAEAVDLKITRDCLLELLDGLAEKYREVLVLNFFEAKNYQEIAFILKKPVNTVSTLIKRGKEKLRQKINQSIKII